MQLDLSLLKRGDVILSSPQSSWVSRGVRHFEREAGYPYDACNFSHTAGYLGDGQFINARWPLSRVEYLQQSYVDKAIPFVVLRPKGLTDEERVDLAIRWAELNNEHYDILSLFWWVIKIGHRNFLSSQKKLICSELIARGFFEEALQTHVNFQPTTIEKVPENAAPASFYYLEKFDIVLKFSGAEMALLV